MKTPRFATSLLFGLAVLFVVVGSSVCCRPTGISESELALRLEMRRLWDEHVTWTRMYIVSAVEGLPDTNASATRLLRNQDDIGNAFKPYYGVAVGNELSALLRGRIAAAGAVLTAAKSGHGAGLGAAQAAWMTNADSIAAFLARINPEWPERELRNMLHEHLRLTTGEAVARLKQQYDADIAAFDEFHQQALAMADALTAGIVKQFPGEFN